MRKTRFIISTVLLSMAVNFTTMAGSWKNDVNGWWYDNGDGSYPVNQWVWIDGNGDNMAECYYFNEKGYMVTNREVDGYMLNANGQWVDVNGVMQTKAVNNAVSSTSTTQGSENRTDNKSTVFDEVHDNWRDYAYLFPGAYKVFEQFENDGAHVYYNGQTLVYEWPDGKPENYKDPIDRAQEQLANEIQSVIDNFKKTYAIDGRPDIEKELLILMYIATNCSYNKEADRPYSAEGCLLDGEAVCEGYALAFKTMAEACGLEAKYLHNKRHAWNMVKINGNWYHVDPTFADKNGVHKELWGDEELYIDSINLSDEASKKLYSHKTWADVGVTAPKTYKRAKLEELVQQFHDEYYITQKELDRREEAAQKEEKQKAREALEKKNKKWKKQHTKLINSIDEAYDEIRKLKEEYSNAEGDEKERINKEIEDLQKKREQLMDEINALDKEAEEGDYNWA